MKHIGSCNGLPERGVFSDLRVDHAGYFATMSFGVEGQPHRHLMIVRPGRDAAFILPVDFVRREAYLIRAPRHNRFFAVTERGREAVDAAVEGHQDVSRQAFEADGEILNAFDTAAGMLDPGETADAAALREMGEELGILPPGIRTAV